MMIRRRRIMIWPRLAPAPDSDSDCATSRLRVGLALWHAAGGESDRLGFRFVTLAAGRGPAQARGHRHGLTA